MSFIMRVPESGIVLEAPNDGWTFVWDAATRTWTYGPGGGGGGAVDSVFGRTGVVIAVIGDYDSDQIDNLSLVPGISVSDALDSLNVGGGFQTPNTIGNLGATPDISFATNRYQIGTLNVNATIGTMTPPSGYECYLELIQGPVGGFTVTWPANVDWTDGLEPVLSTASGARDLIKFVTNGTRLRGFVVLMNLSP